MWGLQFHKKLLGLNKESLKDFGGERMLPETCLSAGMGSDLLAWDLWKIRRDSLFPLKNTAALGTKQYLTEAAFRDHARNWKTSCSRPEQLLLRDILASHLEILQALKSISFQV